ncbi:MAG: hypothetical protein A3G34_06535 [Candidatus Lindowbacteria bacterium RIFCSPLOWO2_12_FULL_62_27]|nr:MAG: hypothetical protein A3G34_06535 [Candidatus Lindowbacteria bacterium RIFCSPLOWO2_12_FULL_62_27]OGH63040.1 MAG: hypothetical protein A3I06_16435 [Candidatus Lindowbacteria bacterium RIFCSPLOWO2_02_FULL_62_12]
MNDRTGIRIAIAFVALASCLLPCAYAAADNTNMDILHFATRLQRFDELVFKLEPGDNKQARLILKGLDVLSGEIADYRIRNKVSADPTLESISQRINKLRQDILRIESATPEEVENATARQVEVLKTVSWDVGNLEDKVARLAGAGYRQEEKTRILSGKTLPAVAEDIGKHMELIADGLARVSEGNAMMSQIQERLLANPGIYGFDAKLIDRLNTDRRSLDDLQAILSQRQHEYTSVRSAIEELTSIDDEIQLYPANYAQAIADFRSHLYLSSPEAFSAEMRHAHGKLQQAEKMIEEGRRTEATVLLVESREAYDKWAPTYQRAEELYLNAKGEHDRTDALGARRTALYAFLFQTLAGTLRDPSALEQSESKGMRKYLRAVEPLHDDFAFLVDRYQTVAETWAYVGGAGLKQRLQALLLDAPAGLGKTRVVQK